MAFDPDIGKPGKRSAAAFSAQLGELFDRAAPPVSEYATHTNRTVGVNAEGTALTLTGDRDFSTGVVSGGRIKQFDMPAGNQTLSLSNTGNRHASRSATGVNWTLPGYLFTSIGVIIPWIQLGAGAITFVESANTEIHNDDDHTKSGGLYSSGLLECVDIDGDGTAHWLLTGKTSA